MLSTARWENNNLMVKWYGGSIEDIAATIERIGNAYRMVFDGNEETMIKTYPDMPDAEIALRDIIDWQNNYY